MKVRVKLESYLDQYAPGDEAVFDCELPEGATIRDLNRKLGVPEEMASVIVVGGDATTVEHTLGDGDRVTIIPPIAGG
jgi:molybdopterin converting factor small subunit